MADHHSHQTSSLKRKRSPPDHAPTSRFKQEDDEPVEQINRSYDQNGSSLVSSLTEHDRYASITDRIIDHLGIVDILALTRTSKSLSNLYNNSLPRHWDIDQRLSRFVTDPTKFRRILGRNNGLIVGSLPLQFFSRLQWDDSSLDILVEKGEAATAMKAHIRSQGYREPNIIDYDMGHSGIHFKVSNITYMWIASSCTDRHSGHLGPRQEIPSLPSTSSPARKFQFVTFCWARVQQQPQMPASSHGTRHTVCFLDVPSYKAKLTWRSTWVLFV